MNVDYGLDSPYMNLVQGTSSSMFDIKRNIASSENVNNMLHEYIPRWIFEEDRKYKYIFNKWEYPRDSSSKVDIIPEEYVESEEIGKFLERFRIKEVS